MEQKGEGRANSLLLILDIHLLPLNVSAPCSWAFNITQAYLPVSLFNILCLKLYYSEFHLNPSHSLPPSCPFTDPKLPYYLISL